MDIWLGIYASLMMILGVYAIVNITLNLLYFKKLDRVEDRNDGPLISVVIPARNEEGNIGKLLDSMLAQDYQNLEILVIKFVRKPLEVFCLCFLFHIFLLLKEPVARL